MTYDERAWTKRVLPHSELQPLGERMWIVTGSLKMLPLPRTMVIFKMDDGNLLIHNAIALDEHGMSRLEALGRPTVLVVPSPFHRIDAGAFKERYPALRVVAPAQAVRKVEEKVRVDATAEAELPLHGVTCLSPPGLVSELIYDVPFDGSGARGLLVNDVLFNLPHLPGVSGGLLRLFAVTGFFGVDWTARLLLLRDKRAFAAWLRDTATRKEIRAVSVAHGDAIVGDGSQVSASLQKAAAALSPPS